MTPVTVPFEFEIETFQGERLDTPIRVTGEASKYNSKDEAIAEWPNDATILEWLNSDLLTRAKASARASALASHMEAYQKSDAFKTKQAIKALIALGYSQADAESIAAKQ